MGDPEDPVGKLMFEQRGFFACSLDSGVLKEVSVAVGSATIQITREARQTQQEIQIKGAINPVKAAVPNAPALEFEVSEGEALLKAPKEFQMPKLLRDEHNQDILGSHLIMAAAYKKNDEVKRLLSLGANVNYQHDMGYFYADATALYIAAEQNNLEGVDLLLQAGADINMQRGNRMSALCIALNNRHNQMALHLIQNGAEIDIFTREKNSPLSYARFCSDAVMEAMVNKLIEKYQKNPDDLFKFLETDRHYQKCIENVSSGKKLLILLKLRDFLIAAGFQQDKVNSLLPQEFSFAADNIKHDFLKAVEELPHAAKFNMLKRIVVDEKSWEYQFARFHRGALICRSGHGMLGEAEKLYNAHNVHIADEEKLIKARVEEKVRLNNALIIAASGNNSSQIEAINKIDELIAKGADVNAPFKRVDESSSGNDLTALAVAAANGKTDIVNHLLNKGADPALAVNTTKNNPMFSLKKFGHKYHDNIRNFLAQQSGENISILPEKMAEILREKTIAERLRTIRLEKLSESLQAISMEKDKPAAAQAAEIVFVPPQVTVAQPPSYADAEKMKEEERQAELKAGETAFVPPQRVYPSLASEQPVYIDETKKYIKAGAKLRELGEASQVKLVEVVQPVNPFADMEQIPDQPIAVKESGNPFDDENIQTTVNPFAEDLFAELLGNKTEETDSLETLMECFKPVEKKSVDELLSSDIPVNLPEPMLPTTAVVLQKLGSTPFDDMIDQQEAVKSAARTIFDDLLEQAAPAREPAISKEPVRSYAVPDDFNMQKVQAELDLTEGEHQSNMFTLFNADPAKPEKEIEFPELPDHLKKKSKSAKEKRSDNNQGGVLLAAK
jgi:ankyrin repeat protein